MSDYSTDIKSAYDSIKDAGCESLICWPTEKGVYDPATETHTGLLSAITADIIDETVSFQLLDLSIGVNGTVYIIQIEDEKILVTKTGDDFIINERAFDNTVKIDHLFDFENDIFAALLFICKSSFCVFNGYSQKDISDGVVQIGDTQLIIPAYELPDKIENTCIFFISNEQWKCIYPGIVAPNNIPIIYQIQARK